MAEAPRSPDDRRPGTAPPDASGPGEHSARGLRRVAAIVVACLFLIFALRLLGPRWDFAHVNVATLVLLVVMVLTVLVHIQLRRDLSWKVRIGSVLLLVGLIGGGALLFRVSRVDGRLFPQLTFRWLRKPDQLLAPLAVASAARPVDLQSTTPHDFPQFLGPQRDLRVSSVQLDPDWKTHPPQLQWRRPIGAGWSGFSVVNGFGVTMEQRGAEELVSCYNVRTGEPQWSHAERTRHETTLGGVGPRCTPTIADGRVYALGATGILRCLDGATGRLLWRDHLLERYDVTPRQDLRAVAWGRAASPLVVDDLVVVPFGGPKGGPYDALAAYDRVSGALRWRGGTQQVSYASPSWATLCGIRQILIVNEQSVSGHRIEDGAVLWSFPWPGSSAGHASVSQAVALPGDRVLLSKGYGGGAQLLQLAAAADGSITVSSQWRDRRILKTKFTNVVVFDTLVFGLSDGILECVDWPSGQSRWKDRRQADFGHGQILAVGDHLLVQAESGEVVLVEPNADRYVERGRLAALDQQTWNNLCLSGPYLLVRNAVEAACFELRLRP